MAEFTWLPDLHRYRNNDTGEWASDAEVRGWSDAHIGVSADHSRGLAGALNAGDLTLGQWEADMRAQIKGEYTRQYLLGRGGRDQMTQADWGSIGGDLANQFRYLSQFADAIATGNLSEAQIAARSELYLYSAKQAFEKANGRARVSDAKVKWTLTAAEHCDTCIDYAGLGWRPIAEDPFGGANPGDGSTICMTQCKCHLEYRRR